MYTFYKILIHKFKGFIWGKSYFLILLMFKKNKQVLFDHFPRPIDIEVKYQQ